MYISTKAALVRSSVVAGVNGGITLALLLIAPLGLAAVIVNTLLITASTLVVGLAGDVVVSWLSPSSRPSELRGSSSIHPYPRDDIRRF